MTSKQGDIFQKTMTLKSANNVVNDKNAVGFYKTLFLTC